MISVKLVPINFLQLLFHLVLSSCLTDSESEIGRKGRNGLSRVFVFVCECVFVFKMFEVGTFPAGINSRVVYHINKES